MNILAPSVYAANYMELQNQLNKLEAGKVQYIHVDVMDGHFVPRMAFGPDFIKALNAHTKLKIDVHLMIEKPERMIQVFAGTGADVITIHYEATKNPIEVLKRIHSYGIKCGIVLSPETELNVLTEEIWNEIDVLQIMTVWPGRAGQTFMPEMITKIVKADQMIRMMGKDIYIEVDGGITKEYLPKVVKAGASMIVVGKAIFNGCMEENIKEYFALI